MPKSPIKIYSDTECEIDHVALFERDSNGVHATEACDYHYHVYLNAKDLQKLISFLQKSLAELENVS